MISDEGRIRFELERFAWGAPDRLEVSGRFEGLPEAPDDEPVLVVQGADGTHRLSAVATSSPEDGRPWWAEFAWDEPPVAFEAAELQFGQALAIELPEPGEAGGALDVRSAAAGGERFRYEAELLAAQEEIRELRAAQEQLQEELSRAHADLKAERDRHSADAERFRDGLARVQNAAQEAIEARDAALEHARTEAEALVATIRDALRHDRS
jgi:hypothetical protein